MSREIPESVSTVIGLGGGCRSLNIFGEANEEQSQGKKSTQCTVLIYSLLHVQGPLSRRHYPLFAVL